MNITEILKRARLKKGVTVKQMAELLGVTKSTVYELEQGKHSPTYSSIQRYAEVLGLDVETVLKQAQPE